MRQTRLLPVTSRFDPRRGRLTTVPTFPNRRTLLGHQVMALTENRDDVYRLVDMADLTEGVELDPTIIGGAWAA